MTEKEALDAVAFLNKSLNDGIQLTEANVAPMDLKKCLIKGAGAVQNASNTLTCVVNQVNIWSKADCSLAAKRFYWYPVALKAWFNHLAKQEAAKAAAAPATGVAALTDMNKLKAFASKHCLAKATTAQGSFIWSAITGRDSGPEMTKSEALNAVEFLNKALPAGIQMNDENAKEIGVGHCLDGPSPGALANAAKTINCGITAVNTWSGANCGDIADADRTQWYPIALKAW